MLRHHIIIISTLSIIATSLILVLVVAFYSGRNNKSHYVSYNYGHDRYYYTNMFDDDYNDRLNNHHLTYTEKPWKLDDGLVFGKDNSRVPNSPEPETSVFLFIGLLTYVGYQRKKK